jgi:hypothetical protein
MKLWYYRQQSSASRLPLRSDPIMIEGVLARKQSKMGETAETIIGLLGIAAILIVSAWLTNIFASKMYNRCGSCGLLNAKRRTHCRGCGQVISQP